MNSWSVDELKAFMESLGDYKPGAKLKEAENILNDLAVQHLGHLIEDDERKDSVLDLGTLKRIDCVYKILNCELAGSGAKIVYALHSPYQSMGYVRVEGGSLVFKNTSALRKCMELASNTEVYALIENAVRMTFTFNGLTNKIQEVVSNDGI